MLDGDNISKIAGIATFAILGVAFGIQKLLKAWNSDSAENKIVKMLREELERTSKQNTALSESLGTLQQEVIKLNGSLLTLTLENQRLNTEVSSLNSQIQRLQESLGEK